MFCSTVKSAKDRGFLGQIADAEPGPLIHRQHRDVFAIERNAPVVCRDEARDHVEHGGFAGSVRPQKADRFAPPDGKADALHDHALAIGFLDVVGGEPTFGADRVRIFRVRYGLRRMPIHVRMPVLRATSRGGRL